MTAIIEGYKTDLFGNTLSIDQTFRTKVDKPSPYFALWVSVMRPDDINLIAHGLLRRGEISSLDEAFAYFNEVISQVDLDGARIATGDIERGGTRAPYLRRAALATLPIDQAKKSNILRRQGAIGHKLIQGYITGDLFEPRTQLTLFEALKQIYTEYPPARQLHFQQILPEVIQNHGHLFRDGLVDPVYWREVKAVATGINQAFWQSGNSNLPALYMENYSRFVELRQLLAPLVGQFSEVLDQNDDSLAHFYSALTRWSWIEVIDFLQTEVRDRVVYPEIEPINPQLGVAGGRIDAAMVTRVGDHEPTVAERTILKQLLTEKRGQSKKAPALDQMVLRAEKVFGQHLQLQVIDWKMLVGDSPRLNQLLRAATIAEGPLLSHQWQAKRYQYLVALGLNIGRGMDPASSRIFDPNGTLQDPSLEYFTGAERFNHSIPLSREDLEHEFLTRFARRLPIIQQRVMLRLANLHLQSRLEGRSKPRSTTHYQSGAKTLSLFSADEQPSQVDIHTIAANVVARHEAAAYLDPGIRLVKKVQDGDDGKQILRMDVGRLMAGIYGDPEKTGCPHINSTNFDPTRGGFIECPNPDHDDSTPSCMVYLDQGSFHCFGGGCGVSGFFDITSIPRGADIKIRASRGSRSGDTKDGIPQKLHDVLFSAHELEKMLFAVSPAAAYLEGRGLPLGFALDQGAGFGDGPTVVADLLRAGFNYQDLIEAGLIGFSEKGSSSNPLYKALKAEGLKHADIVRVVFAREKRKTIPGFPYYRMQNRVTFEMSIDGKYSNIYGRDITGKRLPHVKLHTGFSQGAWGLDQVIEDDEYDEVIMTEAVIDALSLRLMGARNTFARIGTDNATLTHYLAKKLKKDIALANDTDEPGRKASEKDEKMLKNAGFKGSIRDYTLDFLSSQPAFMGHKDWNSYLKYLVGEGLV